jgi:alpha-L-arabinofuranosidase
VQKMFSENRGDKTLPIKVQSPVAEIAPTKGMIGVGTWNTSAEFKDVKVTAPDGTTLFASDFSANSDAWKKLGNGNWSVENGSLSQKAEKEFVRALAGDKAWTDYTLTLKAQKISGQEGFLVLFHISGDDDRIWWNIGGWKNTQNGIENGGTLDPKLGSIETGRWYDIKVVVQGKRVKCFLDGKLIHDLDYESAEPVKALYATAAQDDRTGDVIVKVVNASANPLETKLDLGGERKLGTQVQASVLTSEKDTDENSITEPMKVSPKTETLHFTGTTLTRTFPGNSFTVLRFQGQQ